MTAAALPPDVIETTTTAALEEKAKLQRHFGRFDIFFFLICTIVGLDTLGAVSNYGAQAFVWIVFLSGFFFVPYALPTAELGSAFREEGGSYIWTKLSMGRFAAGLNAVLYWLSNPIWLGGALAITALSVFDEFSFELGHVGSYIFAPAFIWFATWAAILSFGVGKWIPTIGAWGRIVLISEKDVPYTVKRATIVAILAYGLPILAILLVVPAKQITSLDGFVSAIKLVFTVYGGSVEAAADGTLTPTLTGAGAVLGGIAAAGFIRALSSSGTTWIMGADRAQAVAAHDGAGPRWLGTFSDRWGTPITVNLASGVFSTVTFVAALGLAISTTTISYLSIFPSLYLLRKKHPHVHRPYQVPAATASRSA